ncbi:hypothetical protein N665_0084s0012 [Sinapis alba]|nr:hypothetical protein N665_0084s0012 [Sinapis alba]
MNIHQRLVVNPFCRLVHEYQHLNILLNNSYRWRKLLKLRDVAYGFFRIEVKDGRSTRFWFDNWLGKGRLIDITGTAGTTYIGVPRRALVSDTTQQDNWAIRGQRSRHYHDLYASIVAKPVPDPQQGRDIVLWRVGDDDYQDKFSSTKNWDQIRERKNIVGWSKVVWFAQGIPRYSFITWLAVKNRLSTGDRMRTWGMVQGCTLCGERDETRDHLYFACPYSFTVWHGLANRILGSHTNSDWQLTLQHTLAMRAGVLDTILFKLLLQMNIYHIWRERNARRHHTSWKTAEAMHTAIDKDMRNRISSLKYRIGHKLAGLLQRWFLHTL